ncbi:MAG: hypothetical protein NWQ46_00220, partial [Spirosomaceae bacterium]|nr:hypothetical protein [Spirosomataceae bacterium]
LIGCKKDSVPANLIVGEWQLQKTEVEQSGNIVKKNKPNKAEVLVRFDQNGEFNETYKNVFPVDFGFLGCGGGNYELEGENGLRIRATCMSSLSGQKFTIIDVSTKELILTNDFGSKFSFGR